MEVLPANPVGEIGIERRLDLLVRRQAVEQTHQTLERHDPAWQAARGTPRRTHRDSRGHRVRWVWEYEPTSRTRPPAPHGTNTLG
ncbi:hypothetical protein B4N89_36630 [Embleya scabrispora]|uniref:Uncharacterized protein n=1 Tax=Embleya scabrispora TaxID=159449 RepID=A0A1T3NLU8_9ACTN|nr:hypothetical protein B4N89_36630 [Embleya scabrispora]